jgi:thymidylate synthase ThyX
MIEAKIIKDSVSAESGVRLTTFELDYPRFIHAEIMTHRVFSRNAQSSRAVPVKSTLAVNQEWVTPIVWGKNKAGMSSEETLQDIELESAKQLWDEAAKNAFVFSDRLAGVNLHKQYSNRVTEPFCNIKVLVTATEWDNFFWLRIDPDAAQPEIVELAKLMDKLYDQSEPSMLYTNQWHLPYVSTVETETEQFYVDSTDRELTEEEAIKISASCCAQISYRRLNDTYEKAIEIYDKLFSGPKPHLSPTEHQAKVIKHFDPASDMAWPKGITHIDRNDSYWSGNLQGWVQYRQLLG